MFVASLIEIYYLKLAARKSISVRGVIGCRAPRGRATFQKKLEVSNTQIELLGVSKGPQNPQWQHCIWDHLISDAYMWWERARVNYHMHVVDVMSSQNDFGLFP